MWSLLLACAAEVAPPPVADYALVGPRRPGGAQETTWLPPGSAEGAGTEALTVPLVTPGFVDAHGHVAGLGRALAELTLTGAESLEETLARVEARCEGEGWLSGRGWDQNDWGDARGFPTAADLDTACAGRPLALRRVDGHALWLNSAGLAAAGVGPHTPDPEGGRILRGPGGAPTGVLVDAALALVTLPDPPPAERERRLRAALAAILKSGLVGVHDMGVGDEGLALYRRLEAEGALPVRIFVYLAPDSQAAARLAREGPIWGDRLSVVGVKLYADGALGSRGAWLSEDYADEPGHQGLALSSRAEIADWATRLLEVEASLAVHAIGDRAVREVLDAYAEARAAVPGARIPLRIEHAQVIHPDDRARFAALNVVASMQPTHATSDMPWAERRLGPERVRWAYAWRSMLDAGALVAFGSDFPVEEVAPNYGMFAATTRGDLDGQPAGGWLPDERLTFDQALAAFTRDTYAAIGREPPPGDYSLWTLHHPDRGPWFSARHTILGGQRVYTGPADPGPRPGDGHHH